MKASVALAMGAALVMVGMVAPLYAQELTFTTLAGPAEVGPGWHDGTGAAARFVLPSSVAADGSGSLFVADYGNHTIRKVVVATGEVTTLAGTAGQPGSADGRGAVARFKYPFGVALDGGGNLFVADTFSSTIRKIVVATGEVTTLAGTAGVFGSVDGTGGAAKFLYPYGVATDGNGNLFVADTENCTIRKIVVATREVTTLAGSQGTCYCEDGTGTKARFFSPRAVAADGGGNLFVADTGNHAIRKIVVATGQVTTLAGAGKGSPGSADGVGTAATFNNPSGVAADDSGNLFVADTNNSTMRRIVVATGEVTTLVGTPGFSGWSDGNGAGARFRLPSGIASGGSGTLYVADSSNYTIRKIAVATAEVTTLAGTAPVFGSADGIGAAARFNNPSGVAADGSGTLFVADRYNATIRRIVMATGEVTTLAGSAGQTGSADGTGAAARFSHPEGVAVDGGGNLFVADSYNHTIRKVVVATGEVTTLAGTAGARGSADGTGAAARFNYPSGIAMDGGGNVFLADTSNHTIRKIVVATGEVTTLAGTAGTSGSADGTGAAARFKGPTGMAADGSGNVFVVDADNSTIRRIVAVTGEVTTLAGTPGAWGWVDGTGAAARFRRPAGVATDGSGTLFVADFWNYTIRKIVVATGQVTTVAGTPGSLGSADGTGAAARLNNPRWVAVDGSGNLFVADSYNDVIRRSGPTLADTPTIDLASAPVGVQRQLGTTPQTATSWSWAVVRRPSGGMAQLSNPGILDPTITPDVEDLWQFRLRADGPGGERISYVSFVGLPVPVPRSLTVLKVGNGIGTVTSDPAGIDCGSTCSVLFIHGTAVTLTPTAAPGSRFVGWFGACTGPGTCTIAMAGDRAVTAKFDSLVVRRHLNRVSPTQRPGP